MPPFMETALPCIEAVLPYTEAAALTCEWCGAAGADGEGEGGQRGGGAAGPCRGGAAPQEGEGAERERGGGQGEGGAERARAAAGQDPRPPGTYAAYAARCLFDGQGTWQGTWLCSRGRLGCLASLGPGGVPGLGSSCYEGAELEAEKKAGKSITDRFHGAVKHLRAAQKTIERMEREAKASK
eukprot:1330735-Rhodomonas_salina.1